MSYFVVWTPAAHDRLEQFWMDAEDNQAVLRAANAIDVLLAEDPFRQDAADVGDECTFIVEPLAVDYRVSEADRKVHILTVWMIGYLNDPLA